MQGDAVQEAAVGGDVGPAGDEVAVDGLANAGHELLGRAFCEVVEILARRLNSADDGRVELFSESQRQAGDQRIVEGRGVTPELVGEGDDDGQLVGLHQLGAEAGIADGLRAGLGDPRSLRILSDHRDLNAAAGEIDLTCQAHDGAGLLGFLKDFPGDFSRQGDIGSVGRNATHCSVLLSNHRFSFAHSANCCRVEVLGGL